MNDDTDGEAMVDGGKTDNGYTITIDPPIPFRVLLKLLHVLRTSG
jgi:hypothetical protein